MRSLAVLSMLVAARVAAADPGQPDLSSPQTFCDSLVTGGELPDLGLRPYPRWTTEHKRGQRVACNWSGEGKGAGMSVLGLEATCGKQKHDAAFCASRLKSFESGQKILEKSGVGKTAKGFFEEKIEGAPCHTLALGLSGDTDFVYLDNGCYFVLNQVTVEHTPKETKDERLKQAKLNVARRVAERMRPGKSK